MRLGLSSTRLLLKVIEHSFLVPMRYSSLFSNQWQLGGNCQWLDASSTKKRLYSCYGNTAGNKPALNNGFELFPENPVKNPRKLEKILAY